MENIVFDRNYELTSEDNGYADAIYEKAIEPDGFFASFGKKMDAIPKIIVPEDQANYEYLLERCDQFAQDHHGRIHAVVDYQHFHSEINLYLRMIEFDCEEDMSLLKDIGERAHYVCITPEEGGGFRIHIMINYFQELMTDEQCDYLKYETIMENKRGSVRVRSEFARSIRERQIGICRGEFFGQSNIKRTWLQKQE